MKKLIVLAAVVMAAPAATFAYYGNGSTVNSQQERVANMHQHDDYRHSHPYEEGNHPHGHPYGAHANADGEAYADERFYQSSDRFYRTDRKCNTCRKAPKAGGPNTVIMPIVEPRQTSNVVYRKVAQRSNRPMVQMAPTCNADSQMRYHTMKSRYDRFNTAYGYQWR